MDALLGFHVGFWDYITFGAGDFRAAWLRLKLRLKQTDLIPGKGQFR